MPIIYNTRNPPTGLSAQAFVRELISPPIDLSSVETPFALLSFLRLGWLGTISPPDAANPGGVLIYHLLAYSTNGGQLEEPITVNPYQTPSHLESILKRFPSIMRAILSALPEVEGSPIFA